MATPVAQEGGDTIFAIDRDVEAEMIHAIDDWPAACRPLELIAEGLGESGRRTWGAAKSTQLHRDESPRFRLLVDPIDGTRNIMYDKRAAWFIAAVTPGCREDGSATTLHDAIAAVIVELPTSKQRYADAYGVARDSAVVIRRQEVATGEVSSIDPATVRPSQARDLRNGFAQVSNFFPGTKVLAAELMERIVHATLGDVQPGEASVFDDQYITTAGQMVELMIGHDRFCCDLRPLFYDILSAGSSRQIRGLECHPYDVAGAMVARQAGVLLTDGWGRPLDAPLDVHRGVHWCGYANERLQDRIAPVISDWLTERGLRRQDD